MFLVDAEAVGDVFHPGREASRNEHIFAIGGTGPKVAETQSSVAPFGKLGRRVPMGDLLEDVTQERDARSSRRRRRWRAQP